MKYPPWICERCGKKYGAHLRESTWHIPDKTNHADVCGWCNTDNEPLTEPRDYGYPACPDELAGGTAAKTARRSATAETIAGPGTAVPKSAIAQRLDEDD
jgi:hypothetical protein